MSALSFGDMTPYMVCLVEDAEGRPCGLPYRHEGPHREGDSTTKFVWRRGSEPGPHPMTAASTPRDYDKADLIAHLKAVEDDPSSEYERTCPKCVAARKLVAEDPTLYRKRETPGEA